ncbi:NAD(P)-binding protein [Aspergillus lucknowensis]|uniref:NAD(P)-binding protein n=1 Tax=Aspergillus lucknowensis TaxID=176173 RepID=A0ABR4LNT7_9EURO
MRIFITGSSDGIGLATAKLLADQGHAVVLHARNPSRAASTQSSVPNSAAVLTGDLSSISETKALAADAKRLLNGAPFDTIIHNAGIGYGATASREITADGIAAVFAVNTLAPYILTCLMGKPSARLLFMSSDSHYGGDATLRNGGVTRSHSYADSKLHDVMLANAFARRWGATEGGGDDGVQVVSMHPGWVRTKMGGGMAPVGLERPARVLAEWAVGKGEFANLRSGAFFTTRGEEDAHPGAGDVNKQEELLRICREVSGVAVPGE